MKKIIGIIILLIIVCGCSMKMMHTPSEKVTEWMRHYQERDENVVKELEDWLETQELEEELKKEYQKTLEKQYQNLSYEIIKEETTGEEATVVVEIEVLDYHSSIDKSEDYYEKHREEFGEENQNNYMKYKIEELSKVDDKTKYQITFDLIKIKNDWEVKDINEDTFLKLYGLY